MRIQRQDGAMSPEYVAVVLVVSSLVTAIVALALPTTVGDWGAYAVCRLFGSDACTKPGQLPPLAHEDYIPTSCDVSSSSYTGSVEGAVLFFDAERGISFARTERSDGTTAFTVVNDGTAGISAEVGVEADLGGASLDVGAEAGLGGGFELGSTWIVPTEDANAFQGQLLEEVGEDAAADSIPLVGGIGNWIVDQFNGDLRGPDITFSAGGLEVGAEVSATVDVFGEQVAGASVGVEGAVLLGVEEDRTGDDETAWRNTEYFQVDLSANGQLGFLTAQVGGDTSNTQILAIARDLDGNVTEVSLSSSVTNATVGELGDLSTQSVLTGGSQTSVVQTITIPAGTAEEREILTEWLLTGDADGFDDLVHQRAQYTILEYDGDEFGLSLGGEVALGAKLGLKGSFDQLDNEIVRAWYFGAPDAAGVRSPTVFSDCLAALGS